jgi:enoyl-CoA hydratase/carnithine racemase
MKKAVPTTQHDRVVVARLGTRPDGLMDARLVEELAQLVSDVENDPDVGAVVFHGDHPTRFLSHYDVRELADAAAEFAGTPPELASLLPLPRTLLAMEQSGVAFVAAIDGSALGGGCELALACDVRIMARGPFVIGLPEVLLGLLPGAGGTQRLPRLIGRSRALELMLDRCWITGEEALDAGLVHELVPAGQVLEAAVSTAHRLATRPKAAVEAIKRACAAGQETRAEAGFIEEQRLVLERLAAPGVGGGLRRYVDRTATDGELPFYSEGLRDDLRQHGLAAIEQTIEDLTP